MSQRVYIGSRQHMHPSHTTRLGRLPALRCNNFLWWILSPDGLSHTIGTCYGRIAGDGHSAQQLDCYSRSLLWSNTGFAVHVRPFQTLTETSPHAFDHCCHGVLRLGFVAPVSGRKMWLHAHEILPPVRPAVLSLAF